VEKERYRAAVDNAKAHLDAGSDLDSALAAMRANGLSEIHCINAVHELLDVDLGRASALVYLSPTFADHDAAPEVMPMTGPSRIFNVDVVHTEPASWPIVTSSLQAIGWALREYARIDRVLWRNRGFVLTRVLA
jgi:hypothetical protein